MVTHAHRSAVQPDSGRQLRQHPDPGLLGGKYVGISPGGSDTYLKNGSHIDQTQSAIVLESLINKFFAGFASKGDSHEGDNREQYRQPSSGAEEMRCVTVAWAAALVAALPSVPRLSAGRPRRAAAAPAGESAGSGWCRTAAQGMLKDLDANRAGYRKDPAKVNALVDKYLLPHFDTEYSARLVLGQHWRTATAEQRKRFIDAFYHSLLANYGTALVDFTADRLKIFPYQGRSGRDQPRSAPRSSAERRPRGRQLQRCARRRGLEGLGRDHRWHQLREELSR